MKKIAVLGGGGTGITMAADLTLKGFSVTLYEKADAWENLRHIREAGGVEMTGRAATGFAAVTDLTDNLDEAVRGADVVLVAVVATRHAELAAQLGPLLADGQTVCFSAGNCGSMLLRKHLAGKPGVVTGEMLGNVYPCRLVGRARVHCAFPYAPKRAAAFPARDTEKLLAAMQDVYPCVAAKNVLDTALNAPNLSIHLAGSLLNAGAVERNPQFRLYAEGITRGVLACIARVEREKAMVLEKLGLALVSHLPMMEKVMDYANHRELDDFRQVAGPDSLTHRYIAEDASTGQALLISLAKQFGLAVPCMEALVTLASVVNGVDYLATGMTAASLGLAGKTPAEIADYLERGDS